MQDYFLYPFLFPCKNPIFIDGVFCNAMGNSKSIFLKYHFLLTENNQSQVNFIAHSYTVNYCNDIHVYVIILSVWHKTMIDQTIWINSICSFWILMIYRKTLLWQSAKDKQKNCYKHYTLIIPDMFIIHGMEYKHVCCNCIEMYL